jgi:hypothetical protein
LLCLSNKWFKKKAVYVSQRPSYLLRERSIIGYSQVQTDFEKPGASRGGREQGTN